MSKPEITIKETEKSDLDNVLALWNDGDVMRFVGFPDGLGETMDGLLRWFGGIERNRPRVNHYSVCAQGLGYCGEAFYAIDPNHGHAASLDIKLFAAARGRGIGHAALSHAIDAAFANDARTVWVAPDPTNQKALALYECLGFRRADMPAYLQEDEAHGVDPAPVYMELAKADWARRA